MSAPNSWDIFCRVVDNYGDAGVCWRLARALAAMGATVRLWIDDLASLAMLAPDISPDAPIQCARGIEVHGWDGAAPQVTPAEVCVEAFGCGVPDGYVQAMAGQQPQTLWIVLEYLSAEAWVREHHALPSPHPRVPLPRYFFFPGFEPGTGGLLREPDLQVRRDAFGEEARGRFWRDVGFDAPLAGEQVVSVFAYPGAPFEPLLEHWARGDKRVVAAVPVGGVAEAATAVFRLGQPRPGAWHRRGALELRILPFLPQERYDEALWAADCNFVRGEDSFVRAQWAGKPFVWHIYPQKEQVHRLKLDAFLGRYGEGLPAPAADALRDMWYAWNQLEGGPVRVGAAWERWWKHREIVGIHTRLWGERLGKIGDLAENLAEFCRGKLKY